MMTEFFIFGWTVPLIHCSSWHRSFYIPLSEGSVSGRTTPGSTGTPGHPDRGRGPPTWWRCTRGSVACRSWWSWTPLGEEWHKGIPSVSRLCEESGTVYLCFICRECEGQTARAWKVENETFCRTTSYRVPEVKGHNTQVYFHLM